MYLCLNLFGLMKPDYAVKSAKCPQDHSCSACLKRSYKPLDTGAIGHEESQQRVISQVSRLNSWNSFPYQALLISRCAVSFAPIRPE